MIKVNGPYMKYIYLDANFYIFEWYVVKWESQSIRKKKTHAQNEFGLHAQHFSLLSSFSQHD